MLIALLLIVSACSPQETEPVRIGALFPLTGGLSLYGEVARNSAQIAVEEINSAGGIDGRMLEVDYQDHQCNAKTAISIFEQLSETQKVKVFTSAACSGTVLAIAPVLQSKNAVLLGTIVTTPKITGISPYVFRNWASDAKEAKLFAEEIKKRNYKKIGVIYEQTDYAQGLKISLEKYLEGSGVSIVSESFASDDTDVRTQITKLKDQNVELLFISPQTITSGNLVLKQLGELQFKPELFVNDNILKATDLLKNYKELLEGATSADYVLEETPKFAEFLQKYKARYGMDCKVTNVCAGVYDAVHLLARAMESGENGEQVRAYLKSVNYDGVSGSISFDDMNDRSNTAYSLFTIQNGKGIRVK